VQALKSLRLAAATLFFALALVSAGGCEERSDSMPAWHENADPSPVERHAKTHETPPITWATLRPAHARSAGSQGWLGTPRLA
jgi:hypothetical protein